MSPSRRVAPPPRSTLMLPHADLNSPCHHRELAAPCPIFCSRASIFYRSYRWSGQASAMLAAFRRQRRLFDAHAARLTIDMVG